MFEEKFTHMVGCPLCPKKTACCLISMDSLVALKTQTGSVESGTGGALELLWCQQRLFCGLVHKLPCVFDGNRPQDWWSVCESMSANDLSLAAFSIFGGAWCRTTEGPRSQCPCTACAGSLALSCQPQALHTAVDGAYSGRPSYDMSHPS